MGETPGAQTETYPNLDAQFRRQFDERYDENVFGATYAFRHFRHPNPHPDHANTVVLIDPGLGGTPLAYEGLAKSFAHAGFGEVVVIEHATSGGRKANPFEFADPLVHRADQNNHLLSLLNAVEVVGVGHSTGGETQRETAIIYPDIPYKAMVNLASAGIYPIKARPLAMVVGAGRLAVSVPGKMISVDRKLRLLREQESYLRRASLSGRLLEEGWAVISANSQSHVPELAMRGIMQIFQLYKGDELVWSRPNKRTLSAPELREFVKVDVFPSRGATHLAPNRRKEVIQSIPKMLADVA